MHLANPWGLLALLAIPAILTIHLYRRRYPPLVVAGLHLWSPDAKTNPPGRRRDRLPISASLILELLAALFLAVVLADPKFGRVEDAPHLIAVLDNSASMQAFPTEKDALSFRDSAVKALRSRVESMPRDTRVTVILTGLRPTTLAGPAVLWAEAEKALETWQPAQARHSFDPAWDMAQQLREQSGGEALFLTDKVLPESIVPPWLELAAVGQPLINVGISSVNWTRPAGAAQEKLFIQLQNFGNEEAKATVAAKQNDREVFTREMTLVANGSASLEAPVPIGLGQLTVTVTAPGDGLAVDNVVQLVEPPAQRVRVAVEVSNPRSRRLLERAFQALPQVLLGPRNDGKTDADLVVTSVAGLPTTNTRSWWLGVGPISTAEADRESAKNLVGPYLLDRRNPLLEGVTLGGVVWGGVQPLKLEVLPLISAGQIPLFSQLSRRRNFVGILNIDLERSNLGDTPDWPILLHNLVELRKGDLPGLQRSNYHLGEDVQFRLYEDEREAAATSTTPLELRGPNFSKTLARRDFLELPEIPHAGVYEIHDGPTAIGRFAVNFQDPEESNLRDLSSGTRRATQVFDRKQIQVDSPYTWALLAGLALILAAIFADWYWLQRPPTVKRSGA